MASSSKYSEGTSCSGLSSSSSSSTCSSSSSSFMAADQMVKVEIEAAEALADLAVLAVRESGGEPSEAKWESKWKGKRARKEVKTESPICGFVDSLPSRVDLDLRIQQESGVVSHQPSEKECTNQSHAKWETTRKMLKAEKEEAKSLNAEKEERRIRRILANRESARKTIRRRQALCKELTKKAADLAWENENLKREKEFALKEYQSLESTNKELKEQMAQAVRPKEEETPGNNRSSHVLMPPLPTNYPLFLFSRPPCASYFWPSLVQPSSRYHELHNVAVIPSSIHFPGNNNVCVSDYSHVQENLDGLRTPFCIVPCSWMLPHHDHRNLQSPQASCLTGNNQEDVYSNSQNSANTSNVVVYSESRHSCLPSAEEKTEVPDLNEAPQEHTRNTVGAVEGVDVVSPV
ncbi:uncharacterized protein LOC111800433 isoform X3 [Cucurbita pepo subsp. pepo]|uniref:uncharacterized protein LOC111800433 isoform X3 n=1 Tax=Cucurbita pepo subsp. pepo TaxID=3664 RepID=UPI000C9D6D8B|nr:uncharacterized protein LOC111800433 isoform X3 [Cucurbita pepo subsp. pepo]